MLRVRISILGPSNRCLRGEQYEGLWLNCQPAHPLSEIDEQGSSDLAANKLFSNGMRYTDTLLRGRPSPKLVDEYEGFVRSQA